MVKGASLSHLTLLITCNLCVTTRGLHAIPRNTSRNHSGIFAEIPRNYAQYPRDFADLSCRVVSVVAEIAQKKKLKRICSSTLIKVHVLVVLCYFMK